MSAEQDVDVDQVPLEEAAPRIAKITVKGFRAFPGKELPYVFDLGPTGKNLLLYGENGSGKSSLFRALSGLLTDQPHDFLLERHFFDPMVIPDEGFVTVDLTAGVTPFYIWNADQLSPALTKEPAFLDLARRCTFLSYRDLLRLHFMDNGRDRIDIFNLIWEKLLAQVDMGDGISLRRHWLKMKVEREPEVNALLGQEFTEDGIRTQDIKKLFEGDAFTFFMELENDLNGGDKSIQVRANQLLQRLEPGLSIDIRGKAHPDLPQGEASLRVANARQRILNLHCRYYDQQVLNPGFFLNEARLSAIALCLFLAGAERCFPKGAEDRTRILVLDDVLIGLDMSHRIPVLRLLQEEFGDWQIFLFTHDRVWYELAQAYIREKDPRDETWVCRELIELKGEPGKPSRPYIKESKEHLERAEELLHGKDADLMGAAVHVRAHFEELLREMCEKYKVKVSYLNKVTGHKANDLWTALSGQGTCQRAFSKMGVPLIREVEMVRSNVLNELSHTGTPQLVKKQLEDAIDVMKRMGLALA